MHRERISDDIYVFTSGLYAQVTAGAIITSDGAIIIDTLPFPAETRQVIDYVERRSPHGIRFVIYTHYHADHTYGGYLFKDAQFISHHLCRQLLIERGEAGMELARAQNPQLADMKLRLPDIVFSGSLTLRLGNKTIELAHAPGHSPDLITAYVKEDKILFASDTVMPVPYIVDGDTNQMTASLTKLKSMSLENVVQGHGEIVLRGEIAEAVNSSLNYLQKMQGATANALLLNQSRDDLLREYDIESCGKARTSLNGLVQQLHAANLITTYDRLNDARTHGGTNHKLRALVQLAVTKPVRKVKGKRKGAAKKAPVRSSQTAVKAKTGTAAKARSAAKPARRR
jgi:cyclase